MTKPISRRLFSSSKDARKLTYSNAELKVMSPGPPFRGGRGWLIGKGRRAE